MCVKNFAVICLPLSVSSVLGGPYTNTQCVVNAFAKSHAVMRLIGTVTGPRRSRATSSSGAFGGKSFISVAFFLSLTLSAAQALQSSAIAKQSVDGQ
eukprot:IDg5322t1